MSEWMADVERSFRRFKLHIQSYCCVCLELQMLIMPQYHQAKTFFTPLDGLKKRNNDEGGKNLFFLSQWASVSLCGAAWGWDGMIIMAE